MSDNISWTLGLENKFEKEKAAFMKSSFLELEIESWVQYAKFKWIEKELQHNPNFVTQNPKSEDTLLR